MQKKSTESAFSTIRLLCAAVLVILGCSFALLSYAASPAAGTMSTSGPVVPFTGTWNGTAPGLPPTGGGEASCTEGTNCDSFALTIAGSPSDWMAANKRVHVQINWTTPASDYDLFIHQGTLAGPVVANSASGGTTVEQVDLDPSKANIGTGLFTVHVVYFATASATMVDQYKGSVTLTPGPVTPLPAPTPAVAVSAPRFENYNPPAAGILTLGRSSGEPSIGIAGPIPGHPEGRAMFQSDVQTLRVTFNGCSFPRALWENKPAPTSQQDFDPISFTDFVTGRTFVHLLTFAGNVIAGEASVTDTAAPANDGDVWTPSKGAGIGSGVDHQTIGSGPYHAPLPATAYPRAVYYCSQALVDASCARSDDGGINYGPSTITYQSECGGLHGHVKVSADGSVFLPNKGCGGEQAAVVSEDNGLTWKIRKSTGSTSAGSDPSVASDAANKIYMAFADGDTKLAVVTSTNQGAVWSKPVDVGASFGLNNVVYPAFVAGDAGRAAVAFLGTPTTGGLQGNEFRGVWHLYVASTYDGGATWTTVDATPADAVQRGCIWQGGGANVCRNMLDFIDATIDHEGRILVGYADGCAGAECGQAGPTAVGNSYTALASIARQSGGKRMFASFDTAPDVALSVPGTPSVSALRNGTVKLGWSEADNGGSAISAFRIYRGTAAGTETLLASVAGDVNRYNDATATDPTKRYFYKVDAVNAQGVSCKENEVQALFVGDSHVGNGFTVASDATGDQTGAPGNADLDIQSLSVSEPASGLLVFNLKLTDLNLIPNERMWRIVWADPRSSGQQYYVGMTKDAMGVVSFEYGTVATATVGLVLGVPSTTKVGVPDMASFDPSTGLITIGVARSKVGNVQIGDVLGAFSARTYNVVTTQIRGTNAIDTTANANANDFTANSPTYAVVGPIPQLLSAASRRMHGTVGTFDIALPTSGALGIEDRVGGADNSYQVVFTFAGNVSVAGASVTPGVNQAGVLGTASVVGTPTVVGGTVTVNLTGVSNGQVLSVTLLGVNDGSASGDISVPMGILLADVNSSRFVDSADVGLVQRQNGRPVSGTNFRSDVNLSGFIDSADVGLTQRQNAKQLP